MGCVTELGNQGFRAKATSWLPLFVNHIQPIKFYNSNMPPATSHDGPSHHSALNNNATLQDSHKEILLTFVEEYRDANRKERRNIIKKACKEVLEDTPNFSPLTKVCIKKVNGFMPLVWIMVDWS
jgi:hypothetical protein